MILGSELGNFGRTKKEWESYRAGLSQAKRNILDLKRALFFISAQTGEGKFNPQFTENEYDLDAEFSLDLTHAIVELADAVLKKIGVTDEVPGLNTLLSIASHRAVVAGLYSTQKSEIDGYIQRLANSVTGYTNKVLNFIDDVRDRVGNWTGKLSIADLKAVFYFIIKGGSVPPVPSLGERGPTVPAPLPWVTVTPKFPGLLPVSPERVVVGYPVDSFTVHDPAINKWRVFVRA